MAQSFQAIKCYQCHTFQVQIKKKSNRWACKLCGEKQSLVQIYGEGSSKDCRLHVQRLNNLRGAQEEVKRAKLEEANETEEVLAASSSGNVEEDEAGNAPGTSRTESKWTDHLENDAENAATDSEEEESPQPEVSYPRNRVKLNSKWSAYLDNDSGTRAHGKTKRKAELMSSSNSCLQMNRRRSPLHNGLEKEVINSGDNLYDQKLTSQHNSDSNNDDTGRTNYKAFKEQNECSTAKTNCDGRGSKESSTVNTLSAHQPTSGKDLAKVFSSTEGDELDDVLKL